MPAPRNVNGFLAGLTTGALAVWLLTLESSEGPAAPPVPAPAHPTTAAAPRAEKPEPARTEGPTRAAVRRGSTEPFGRGECWLRIGEGYVFGEDAARADPDRSAIDIYCQDIRHGASLHCPHGATPAIAPMTAVGLPTEPAEAAALLVDAPPHLPERNLQLGAEVAPQRTGIGLVRSAAGRCYKLHLAELDGHPEALERRVRIAYEEVPQVDTGGGELQLPAVAGAPEAGTRRAIREAVEIGRRVPGHGHADLMSGSYEVLGDRDGDLRITDQRHVVIDGTKRGKVAIDAGGGLFAPGDLAPDATLEIGESGGAVGVGRDLAGRVSVRGYGYAYVGRDVTGTLDLSNYATAAILGDLRGTVKVRSYIELYLRGRMLGKLDVRGSCWSTFYFQSFTSRADLEALPGDFGQITLHLMSSDLPEGRHEGLGTWREVVVGDPVWRQLAR